MKNKNIYAILIILLIIAFKNTGFESAYADENEVPNEDKYVKVTFTEEITKYDECISCGADITSWEKLVQITCPSSGTDDCKRSNDYTTGYEQECECPQLY